jgi:hypothetical protein
MMTCCAQRIHTVCFQNWIEFNALCIFCHDDIKDEYPAILELKQSMLSPVKPEQAKLLLNLKTKEEL